MKDIKNKFENLNYWLSPQGELHYCGDYGFPCHNSWAEDYLQKEWNLSDYIDFSNKLYEEAGFGGTAYELLHKRGWYRILDWRLQGGKIYGAGDKRLSESQNEALLSFCLQHELNPKIFDELRV